MERKSSGNFFTQSIIYGSTKVAAEGLFTWCLKWKRCALLISFFTEALGNRLLMIGKKLMAGMWYSRYLAVPLERMKNAWNTISASFSSIERQWLFWRSIENWRCLYADAIWGTCRLYRLAELFITSGKNNIDTEFLIHRMLPLS